MMHMRASMVAMPMLDAAACQEQPLAYQFLATTKGTPIKRAHDRAVVNWIVGIDVLTAHQVLLTATRRSGFASVVSTAGHTNNWS